MTFPFGLSNLMIWGILEHFIPYFLSPFSPNNPTFQNSKSLKCILYLREFRVGWLLWCALASPAKWQVAFEAPPPLLTLASLYFILGVEQSTQPKAKIETTLKAVTKLCISLGSVTERAPHLMLNKYGIEEQEDDMRKGRVTIVPYLLPHSSFPSCCSSSDFFSPSY